MNVPRRLAAQKLRSGLGLYADSKAKQGIIRSLDFRNPSQSETPDVVFVLPLQ
jgi:hypothetical protein